MDKSKFIQELYEKGCVKVIRGKLNIDLKIIIGYPYLLHFVADNFLQEAQTMNIDAIVGMPYFGMIHASYLSSKLNKPLCVIKNERMVQRELINPENIINSKHTLNILVIVDNIEKGFRLSTFIESIFKRIKNCKIIGIFTICDNCIANNKYLKFSNYHMFSIINSHDVLNNLIQFKNITNQDFLEIYNTMNFTTIEKNVLDIDKKCNKRLFSIIKAKRSNLLVSLYYSNFFHIVNIVNKISPIICGIVINSNIIEQFTDEKREILKKLVHEKKIIIIDNIELSMANKNVVIKTLKKNFTFCDIVTLRVNYVEEAKVFSEFSLDLLKQIDDGAKGFILIMKGMGYNNNFINQKVLDSCSKFYKYINGILVSKREYYMNDNNMLYITDKIEMIDKTVQNSILNDGCDLVIYNIVEFKTLTKDYLMSIYSSVKLHNEYSWISFCKVNSIEN